ARSAPGQSAAPVRRSMSPAPWMIPPSSPRTSRKPCGWMAPGMWIGSRSQSVRALSRAASVVTSGSAENAFGMGEPLDAARDDIVRSGGAVPVKMVDQGDKPAPPVAGLFAIGIEKGQAAGVDAPPRHLALDDPAAEGGALKDIVPAEG